MAYTLSPQKIGSFQDNWVFKGWGKRQNEINGIFSIRLEELNRMVLFKTP